MSRDFDPTKRTVRIPVRWVDGEWRLGENNALPRIRNNASAEIKISVTDFLDAEEREKWVRDKDIHLLDPGTRVFARVTYNNIPADRLEQTRIFSHSDRGDIRFVEIVLKESLRMRYSPGRKGKLFSCVCRVPALDEQLASLNEAYSKIVARFEPNRRSSTGNAFMMIFIEEDGYCEPLDELRIRKVEERLSAID